MFQLSRAALFLGLITTLVGRTIATTIIQSFAAANCNPGTASYVYYSEQAAIADTECKTPPPDTIAIWVDDIAADAGCTIRTFSSEGCTDILGLAISPGICYFHSSSSPIRSWRIVCGAQDADNPVPAQLAPSSEAERAFTVDATLASASVGNLTFSPTLLTTTTILHLSATSSSPFAASNGGSSRNSTESATWSNILTPTPNPPTQDISRATVGPGNGRQVSGSSSNRRRTKPDSVMLLIGSLLGLGWGVLW